MRPRDLPPVKPTALAELRRRRARPHEATLFYFDPAFDRVAVKVLPGQYFVHDDDVAVSTTLGSCVAACLHDAAAGVGGMNHFMLPEPGSDGVGDARFGSVAMDLLVDELVRQGARRNALQARVFGGGQVMKGLEGIQVGPRNVAFVREFLARERIPLVGGDVLDVHARRICMFPRSGRVLCKRLPGDDPELLA